jgi:hypothetical protein
MKFNLDGIQSNRIIGFNAQKIFIFTLPAPLVQKFRECYSLLFFKFASPLYKDFPLQNLTVIA